jgi:hypothetical protein
LDCQVINSGYPKLILFEAIIIYPNIHDRLTYFRPKRKLSAVDERSPRVRKRYPKMMFPEKESNS